MNGLPVADDPGRSGETEYRFAEACAAGYGKAGRGFFPDILQCLRY